MHKSWRFQSRRSGQRVKDLWWAWDSSSWVQRCSVESGYFQLHGQRLQLQLTWKTRGGEGVGGTRSQNTALYISLSWIKAEQCLPIDSPRSSIPWTDKKTAKCLHANIDVCYPNCKWEERFVYATNSNHYCFFFNWMVEHAHFYVKFNDKGSSGHSNGKENLAYFPSGCCLFQSPYLLCQLFKWLFLLEDYSTQTETGSAILEVEVSLWMEWLFWGFFLCGRVYI